MITDYPVHSVMLLCPACGSQLDYDNQNEPERGCTHTACGYIEHTHSGSVITVLSDLMSKYIDKKNVSTVLIDDGDLPVEIAMLPHGLLPLMIMRAKYIHETLGFETYKGLRFPYSVVEDKSGVINLRAVYTPMNGGPQFHVAAHAVVDVFEEVFTLTHANSQERFKEHVDFNILIGLHNNQKLTTSGMSGESLYSKGLLASVNETFKSFTCKPSNSSKERVEMK